MVSPGILASIVLGFIFSIVASLKMFKCDNYKQNERQPSKNFRNEETGTNTEDNKARSASRDYSDQCDSISLCGTKSVRFRLPSNLVVTPKEDDDEFTRKINGFLYKVEKFITPYFKVHQKQD
ncbi:hypothetical protein HHI36_020868 [Cryptolaemus montrouzieri]|uniref:Uncharacterized protein n=1 Tax=Cryptolaemus montrouzieri TaxID=559131 RepID=A0ABD2NBK9_9CUCU